MVQGAIDSRRKVLALHGSRLWAFMLLYLEDLRLLCGCARTARKSLNDRIPEAHFGSPLRHSRPARLGRDADGVHYRLRRNRDVRRLFPAGRFPAGDRRSFRRRGQSCIWRGYFRWSLYALLPEINWATSLAGKQGPSLFRREDSRFFKKRHLTRAHEFYERYGGKTIILARFVPIIRTFCPPVAGAAGMKYSRYLIYDIVGGILLGLGNDPARIHDRQVRSAHRQAHPLCNCRSHRRFASTCRLSGMEVARA